MKRIALVLVPLVALTACSATSHHHSPAATPTVSTPASTPVTTTATPITPKPSPTPTTWTRAQAARKYLDIVAPSNATAKRMKALGTTVDASNWMKYRAVSKDLVVDFDTEARRLSAGLWPEEVKPKIDALITAVTQDRATLQLAASATDSADVISALSNRFSVSPPAEVVRIALGLPGTS